ncbi:abortive infection system antitoxin AbiGi family protein [Flavitalea sp. BT771]|uniref:abortive infection system antitoxin AbiGi family protein n=1 Tax=Flavitalea sp. BT771 TaxID=3063329 RepID=UPI0026E2BE2B|nr:abortive infection system antitoxin AbiGi family protein [Flavitalea sp. BT771]MDO6435709.1 abortive infection system antitoxin AbiGi family protein [Flavitalea sp. BT771]MDV6224610.1 abortive infection system antitoxin AbiGi family protein [Flavitalea sp. BT771]
MTDQPHPPESSFAQRQVDHVFHYTKQISDVISIIEKGFMPSYCEEQIGEMTYYFPMVSFCNIPIREVELYMHYGKFGIGLSLDWAISNGISPVAYVHERSPLAQVHFQVNYTYLKKVFADGVDYYTKKIVDPDMPEPSGERDMQFLKEVNDITVPALQFMKGWKTMYQDKEIITYLEREWRYVPPVKEGRLVGSDEPDKIAGIKVRKKPHFSDYPLPIKDLKDLRYIVLENNDYRRDVFEALSARFHEEVVIEALINGELFLLTSEQVRNDF